MYDFTDASKLWIQINIREVMGIVLSINMERKQLDWLLGCGYNLQHMNVIKDFQV